jgi:hypothetical protein
MRFSDSPRFPIFSGSENISNAAPKPLNLLQCFQPRTQLEVLKLRLEVHKMTTESTPDAIIKLKDDVKVQIYEAFKRRQRKPLIAATSKLGRLLQWLVHEKPNRDRVISA